MEKANCTDSFVWTPDALINLQHITMLMMEENPDADWLEIFPKAQQKAIQFTRREPVDWGDAETDYESAITKFIKG